MIDQNENILRSIIRFVC